MRSVLLFARVAITGIKVTMYEIGCGTLADIPTRLLAITVYHNMLWLPRVVMSILVTSLLLIPPKLMRRANEAQVHKPWLDPTHLQPEILFIWHIETTILSSGMFSSVWEPFCEKHLPCCLHSPVLLQKSTEQYNILWAKADIITAGESWPERQNMCFLTSENRDNDVDKNDSGVIFNTKSYKVSKCDVLDFYICNYNGICINCSQNHLFKALGCSIGHLK